MVLKLSFDIQCDTRFIANFPCFLVSTETWNYNKKCDAQRFQSQYRRFKIFYMATATNSESQLLKKGENIKHRTQKKLSFTCCKNKL